MRTWKFASEIYWPLVTTTPEGLLAKQIRIHEIWICCPVFCTLRLNVSCWYCPAMMSVALFPTWWEGGLYRAALPAGCVAQEKLGYGVLESKPQNEIFINVSWVVKFPPAGIKIGWNSLLKRTYQNNFFLRIDI